MRTATILQAIAAMRDATRLSFNTPAAEFGWTMANLATARIELEVELAHEHPEVRVEP